MKQQWPPMGTDELSVVYVSISLTWQIRYGIDHLIPNYMQDFSVFQITNQTLTLFTHQFSGIDFHHPIPVTNIQQSWQQKLKLRGLICIQRQKGKILLFGELRWVFLWVLVTLTSFSVRKFFIQTDLGKMLQEKISRCFLRFWFLGPTPPPPASVFFAKANL